MKNCGLFLCAASLGLMLSACESPLPDQEEAAAFTATIAGRGATKTLLAAADENTRSVLWSDGDTVLLGGVPYVAGAIREGGRVATLSGVGAERDTGIGGTELYCAWYPASLIVDGTVPTLPATQHRGGTDASGLPRVSDLPMYAESATTQLTFENICAVLALSLTGSGTVTHVVVSSASRPLCGPFEVQASAEGRKAVPTGTDARYRSVTLDCGVAVTLDGTVPAEFYVAIPAGDYPAGDLTVTFYNNEEKVVSLSNPDDDISAAPNALYEIAKYVKKPAFSVLFRGTTISSEGAPADGGTISFTGSPFGYTAMRIFPRIITNLGFTVEASDPSALANSPSVEPVDGDPVSREAVVDISRYEPYGNYPVSQFTEKPFTVDAAGKKVYFSPGNLQYLPSAVQWRFAEHQWDFVGGVYGLVSYPEFEHGTVYEGGVKSDNEKASATYGGWLDLFGWATSGKRHALAYQPYDTNTSADYYSTGKNLSFTDKSDWGVNDIYAGSTLVPGQTYRTPSKSEWEYLYGSSARGAYRYMNVCLSFGPPREFTLTLRAKEDPSYCVSFHVVQPTHAIYGIMLFPDGFGEDNPSLVSAYSDRFNKSSSWTVMPTEDYLAMERAGCVFLPAAGWRYGRDISDIPERGLYWTSTNYRGVNESYFLTFNSSQIKTDFEFVNRAYSVRLVKDVSATGNATNETEPYTQGGTITTR